MRWHGWWRSTDEQLRRSNAIYLRLSDEAAAPARAISSGRQAIEAASAPVASAAAVEAAATAVIPAGAGIVHAEVVAAHVAVVEIGIGGIRGRNDAAGVVTAIQEMMRQLLARHHARTDREPGGETACDVGS